VTEQVCDLPDSACTRRLADIVNCSKIIFAVALLCVLSVVPASAHGDVHPRINEFSEQIKRSPTNALLYFQRAELYRMDGDYTNALADLNQVAQLDRSLKRVDFLRGQVQLDAGQPQAAIGPLNRYLADQPTDAEAYTVRARVLLRLNRPAPAIEDFTQAIKLSSTPNPELYIERATAWRLMDKPEEAIRGLDEGIRRLGPIVTLQLPAVDAELALKRTDAALARIDSVMTRLQRKETWLVRRAEILRSANREQEARTNYFAALEAINRLPPAHRGTRMTLDLESRIRTALGTNETAK
jgi:tetratricopeptide (TPR) repeat protein